MWRQDHSIVNRPGRTRRTGLLAVVIALGACVGAGPAAPTVTVVKPVFAASPMPEKPAVSSHVQTPQIHHAILELHKNPHLKGVDAAAARVRPTVTKKSRVETAAVHHPLHRRWDYHAWIVLHRGLGTIRGFVHGVGGAPAASARVVLKKPGGGYFKVASRRHVTFTDAEGDFIMTGVRPARYRVVAIRGKIRGHVVTAVHPGLTASVSIKI
jgi:hypothetical protein